MRQSDKNLKYAAYHVACSTHLHPNYNSCSKSVFHVRGLFSLWIFFAGTERTMVFVETKRQADFIAAHLCQENVPTTSIHG